MIYFRRFLFQILLVILFVQVASNSLKANHAVGAELRYECLGGNQYKLIYSFYRDCDGIVAPSSVTINYSSSCFGAASVVLIPIAGTPDTLNTVCSSAQTTCNGGIYTGIEKWIYEGIVTLPGFCVDWRFSTAICCRNIAITTVTDIANYQLYVFAFLNNADGSCNNSASFINLPIINACVGQQVCFRNGVTDIDGDSMSYQIITPLAAAGNAIQYNFPYSASQPILSNPAAFFNQGNGDFCMRPSQPDISLYAILVSEFRNGVLVGQIERDIQIDIQQCTSFYPDASGINETSLFSMNLCPGIQTDFYITSSDPNLSDSTFLSWNDGIAGVQFTSWGGLHDSATFSWTPTHADTSGNPHCFSVTVKDNSCPYFRARNYTYCLTVLDSSHASCITNTIHENELSQDVFMTRNENKCKIEWKRADLFNSLILYDLAGRVIKKHDVSGLFNNEIELEDLHAGIYLLTLDGKSRWTQRVYR